MRGSCTRQTRPQGAGQQELGIQVPGQKAPSKGVRWSAPQGVAVGRGGASGGPRRVLRRGGSWEEKEAGKRHLIMGR